MTPIDLNGQPYTPAKQRPWLNAALRADIANQMACEPAEVEYRLDKREQMDRFIEARVDYERGMRDLDISLSSLAREHDEGRVGDVAVVRAA